MYVDTTSSSFKFLTDQDRNEASLVGRRDLGVIYFDDRDRQRVERRLVGRLERLGHRQPVNTHACVQPAQRSVQEKAGMLAKRAQGETCVR